MLRRRPRSDQRIRGPASDLNDGIDNTQLAFAPNQSFGYLTDSSLNPAYIFLGNSLDASPPASPVGAPGLTVYPDETFTGQDATADSSPVTLSAGTTYILASLSLTTLTGVPPLVGDSFTISLVPSIGSGSFYVNLDTYFDHFDPDSGTEVSATPFTSSSGTVAITSVPEPGSVVSGLLGILIVGVIEQTARRLARPKFRA
jgi:hypothetical protein